MDASILEKPEFGGRWRILETGRHHVLAVVLLELLNIIYDLPTVHTIKPTLFSKSLLQLFEGSWFERVADSRLLT